MKTKFEQLVEEQYSTIRKTVGMRYPREIQFSEEFMESIRREYCTQKINEDASSPVKNRGQKFTKALTFVVSDIVDNEDSYMSNYRPLSEDTEDFVATPEGETPDKKVKEASDKEKEEVMKDVTTDEIGKQEITPAEEPERENKAIKDQKIEKK